jgi:ATP-binding protein involved in chromosome partitioning
MTDMPSKESIRDALRQIEAPGGGDIVELGLVSEIVISSGKAYFSISTQPDQVKEFELVRQRAENLVKAMPGVKNATATLTADRDSGAASRPRDKAESSGFGGSASTGGVRKVKHIVAVASGKGGVGKSTTAVNLALAFAANGHKVGVLDADIYGPSLPRLLGVTGHPVEEGSALAPLTGHGVKVMSMGFLVEEDTPMIWRGPMVMSAITQMLNDVAWGQLDVLVVDMPPGTGDAQLTMAQQVPLAGAIIVSTPQDLALIDARKGLNMFRKVQVPVLGIIENMSYFLCPECGHRSDIFGHGGARLEAEKLGVPFLGEVPLHMDIRETSDSGNPVVVSDPDGAHSKVYRDIAARAWEQMSAGKTETRRSQPRIVTE